MSKSIMQDQKKCYITKCSDCILHEHHIFFGENRKLSEKYGLKVWLLPQLHNTTEYGVHGKNGHELDMQLKREAQEKAMICYSWSTEDFIKIFGRNYL